jgi:EpsI family protein
MSNERDAMSNKRYALLLLLLALAAGLSLLIVFWQPRTLPSRNVQKLPLEIGSWRGREIPVPERALRILETDDAATRIYARPDDNPVVLYVAYSRNNRRIVHPPEICLQGAGWFFEKRDERELPLRSDSLRVVRIVMTRRDERRLLFYWFKFSDRYTTSYLRQQLWIDIGRLWRGEASGSVIEISTQIEPGKEEQAERHLVEFTERLLPHLARRLP